MVENRNLAASGVIHEEDDDEGVDKEDEEKKEELSGAELEAADNELKRVEQAAQFHEEKTATARSSSSWVPEGHGRGGEGALQHVRAAKASLLRAETEQDREHKLCKSSSSSTRSRPRSSSPRRSSQRLERNPAVATASRLEPRVTAFEPRRRRQRAPGARRRRCGSTAEVRALSTQIQSCEERERRKEQDRHAQGRQARSARSSPSSEGCVLGADLEKKPTQAGCSATPRARRSAASRRR